MPVSCTRSLKDLAILTASWPVSASATSRVSCGLTSALIGGDFGHQLLVDMLAAGGVEDEQRHSRRPWREAMARLAMSSGSWPGDDRQAWRRRPVRPARATAPWRRDGWCPARPSARASSRGSAASGPAWREVVVLPEPCRPTIRIGAGGEPMIQRGIFLRPASRPARHGRS